MKLTVAFRKCEMSVKDIHTKVWSQISLLGA